MIETYWEEVAPKNRNDYLQFHNAMYDKMDYPQPRYDEYLEQFDVSFANAISNQFQYLIDRYFDTGIIFRDSFEP